MMKTLRYFIAMGLLALLVSSGFAGTLAQFHIYAGAYGYLGDVDLELYDQDKPVTVGNFISLVNGDYYGDSFFHRCAPGFVIQGGGFYALNVFSTNVIGPPYDNVGQVENFGPITNEFKVGPFHSNTYGTIAMAKTSDPNSATSQFFFNLADNSASLDDTNNSGGFTVFGHVLRGTNYLNVFNELFYGNNLVDLSATYGTNGSLTPLLTELPTAALGTAPPPYDELIYFGVTLLTAQVNLTTNGVREISWTGINGVTNRLEYASSLTGTWQTLTNTFGTNLTAPFVVSDPGTNAAQRFYRVQVLY